MNQYMRPSKKTDFEGIKPVILPSRNEGESSQLAVLIHRRAEEIHHRIRIIRSGLKTNKQRLIFDYICDNTIGRGRASDQIANSQFMRGKRCSKTGKVIDFGCGLRSKRPVREARKSLVKQGIIFEEAVTDEYNTSCPNRYGLVFIRDLLELHTAQNSCKSLEKHTPRGYYEIPPTYEYPSDINKQRCITTKKIKKREQQKRYFMHPEHVDYLIDQIETITGDTHSRGAFAEVALTVSEGKIMELLSILKDRDNIQNKGAWFLAVAKKYQSRRIIRADDPEPPEKKDEREQVIPTSVSLTEKLQLLRPELAKMLDINWKLRVPAVHHKFITGT